FALTLDLKDSPLVPVGPGFYPRIVLALTALLSLGLVVSDVLSRKKNSKEQPKKKYNYPLVAISFGVFALYCAALPGFGFRIATFAYVVTSSALLAPPRGAKGWAGALLLGLFTAFLTWLIFERYLSVLLPRGRWTGF
ncbi:MAG: tripartite tricarboxylate transporter TctB family protein, partial [Betaproteobacteria bacterium]